MKTIKHSITINFNQIISLVQQCNADEKELLLRELMNHKTEGETEAWAKHNLTQLTKAYSENEPDYTLNMVTEPNAEYGKR